MKHSYLLLVPLYGSCLLTACGGGGSSDPAIDLATHLTVTTPTTATAGTAFNVKVTALDAANHAVPGYSGTVHFSSTDRQAMLPANSKLTNGTGTFSATLETVGGQTITATDTVTASITGTSNSIVVFVYRSCTPQGHECLPSFPPCCPGLACYAATTRAYCEPISAAAGAMTSKAEARLAAFFPPRAVPRRRIITTSSLT